MRNSVHPAWACSVRNLSRSTPIVVSDKVNSRAASVPRYFCGNRCGDCRAIDSRSRGFGTGAPRGFKTKSRRTFSEAGLRFSSQLTYMVLANMRTPSIKKAVSYCGLCGDEQSSADPLRRTPLSKQCNKHLQTNLIEAAKTAPLQLSSRAAAGQRKAERPCQSQILMPCGARYSAASVLRSKGLPDPTNSSPIANWPLPKASQ